MKDESMGGEDENFYGGGLNGGSDWMLSFMLIAHLCFARADAVKLIKLIFTVWISAQ